jgi:hypothetical protein
MKKSCCSLHLSVLLFVMAGSKIAFSAELLPSHRSSDNCPPRYLNGEDYELEEDLVRMGNEAYDPYGFSKLEKDALEEIKDWDRPASPSAIVALLRELNERGMASLKNSTSVICDYDVVTFKSLLWFATKIIWKQQERAQVLPHTFQAMADTSIGNIWRGVFEKGLYGLPADEKIAECWRKTNTIGGQKCMEMRPDLVAYLNQKIAEFDPK